MDVVGTEDTVERERRWQRQNTFFSGDERWQKQKILQSPQKCIDRKGSRANCKGDYKQTDIRNGRNRIFVKNKEVVETVEMVTDRIQMEERRNGGDERVGKEKRQIVSLFTHWSSSI